MPLTIVHFTTDSLPRVVTGSAGTSALDVLLPFRVDLEDPALSVTGWHLDVEVDGRSWVSRVRTRRLRAGLADALRDRMARTGVFSFDHLPYYAACTTTPFAPAAPCTWSSGCRVCARERW